MANEDMIQRHEDNFLAKIAGETPVDTNVRNSKEFWLNEIGEAAAEWEAGKSTDDASTKKIYWHTVYFERGGPLQTTYSRLKGYMIILNNSSTPIDSTSFTDLLNTPGFVGVPINAYGSNSSGTDWTGLKQLARLVRTSTPGTVNAYFIDTDGSEGNFGISVTAGWASVIDYGANPIN